MLVLESISASYGPERVVHSVSLSLEAGRFTAIIGPNGSGKSTLLRLAGGLMRPDEGTITLGGRSLGGLGAAQRATRLAFVSQRPAAPPDFSVREVVRLGRFAAGRSLRDQHVAEAIGAMDLATVAERPMGTLSVGQQQRVAVARALAQLGLPDAAATPVRVLLADEPAASMDPAHALATVRILKKIAQAGHVVAVVMHDLSLAALAADDIAILARGRLLHRGSAAEVIDGPSLDDAFGTLFRRVKEGARTVGVVPAEEATLHRT